MCVIFHLQIEYHQGPGSCKLSAFRCYLEEQRSDRLMVWVHNSSNEYSSSLKLAQVLTAQRSMPRCYQLCTESAKWDQLLNYVSEIPYGQSKQRENTVMSYTGGFWYGNKKQRNFCESWHNSLRF